MSENTQSTENTETSTENSTENSTETSTENEIVEINDLDTYNQESQVLLNINQSHLNSIISAIARGEKIVKFGDRYVEYRSISELLSAKSIIEAELAKQKTPRRSKITRLYAKGKGWRRK